MKASLSAIGLRIAVATVVMWRLVDSSFGQVRPSGTEDVVSWSGLPGQLPWSATKLGDRLQAKSKEGVRLVGSLRDNAGERPIQLALQANGRFRLDDVTAQRYVGFDGERVERKNGSSNLAETDKLLETLVLSSPEFLYDGMARGNYVLRSLGGRFQVKGLIGPSSGATTVDLYEITMLEESRGNPFGRYQRMFLAVDSDSQLPAFLRWLPNRTNATMVDTRFLSWVNIGGQLFPGETVRVEAGRETLRFRLAQAQVQQRAPDVTFRVP